MTRLLSIPPCIFQKTLPAEVWTGQQCASLFFRRTIPNVWQSSVHAQQQLPGHETTDAPIPHTTRDIKPNAAAESGTRGTVRGRGRGTWGSVRSKSGCCAAAAR